jgi:tryptophan synthase alpha chain
MSSLATVFNRCQDAGRPAFIAFVTAGDPSLIATNQIISTLISAGADIVEVGFPYSDPLADGPVIQASYQRSLASGTKLDDIFASAKQWTEQFPTVPFVAMCSYSLMQRRSHEPFLDALRRAGFAGIIVPDLPVEESSIPSALAASRQLSFIQLVTPTTPPARAADIAAKTTGFLYVVSVTGITGAREGLPGPLVSQLSHLRSITRLPLCVGFGIGTPPQAVQLKGNADGVIVGSALVRCLEGGDAFERKLEAISNLAKQLRGALDPK